MKGTWTKIIEYFHLEKLKAWESKQIQVIQETFPFLRAVKIQFGIYWICDLVWALKAAYPVQLGIKFEIHPVRATIQNQCMNMLLEIVEED